MLVAQRTGATTEAFRFQRSALTPTPEEQRIDLPLHYHSASTNPPATLARLAAGGAELMAEVAPESVHANDSLVVVHLASVEERPEALRAALDLLESLAMGARTAGVSLRGCRCGAVTACNSQPRVATTANQGSALEGRG